jgi:TPR repeat protein
MSTLKIIIIIIITSGQGNDDAQYYLGQLYETGKGVGKDYSESFKYYKLSSLQNNAKALLSFGFLYIFP